jgi:hypothetical protein
MSPDEFDLFSTYLYLFRNKRVKYKLSFFLIFLMQPCLQQDTSNYGAFLVSVSYFQIRMNPYLKPLFRYMSCLVPTALCPNEGVSLNVWYHYMIWINSKDSETLKQSIVAVVCRSSSQFCTLGH